MSAVHAELARLGSLLRVEVSELDFLAGEDPETLRELRAKVTDRLFDADRGVLESIAKATRLVPGGVSATIATKAFPPALAARVAGVLDTDRAVDLASRVPASYLADLAPSLDPRRVTTILAKLPGSVLVAAGRLLGERGAYLTMADFVGVLTPEQVAEVVPVLGDEALIRTGLLIEDPARLAQIIELLPADRLAGVVRTTASLDAWDVIRGARPHLSESRWQELRAVAEENAVQAPDDLSQ